MSPTQAIVYTANLLEIGVLATSFRDNTLLPGSLSSLFRDWADPQSLRPSGTFMAGSFFICGAAILRKTCYRYLGDHFTFELSLRKEHKLVTTGPYAVVRHPAYTGALMYIVGSMLVVLVDTHSIWEQVGSRFPRVWRVAKATIVALASLAVYLFVQRTRVEDEVLKKEFGEEWVRWSKRTQYRLIPFVY